MSGGSKRTYGNAFNTPPTPKIENKKKKKYAPHDVLQKVFNNKQRVKQLIMNYKNDGGLNENEMINVFSGSTHLENMYKSLTINQMKSVINSIRIKVKKML